VVAWSLAGLAVALLVAGTVLSLLGPWTDGPRLEPHDRAMFTAFLMYAFAGALVASRRPANPIGWLLLADGLLFELAGFSAGYAHAALFARSLALPAGAVIAWAGDAVWNPILAVSAVVVLLFPTGQLRSPRWRPVLLAGVVCAAAAFAADAFAPGPLGGSLSRIDNPLGIADASGALTVAGFIAAIGGPLLLLAALCSALLRFRESAGTDRRQMQVLAYAVALLAVGLVGAAALQLADSGTGVYSLGFVLPLTVFPVAVGIAVLRYRLHDIDVVIERSIVAGGLVAFTTCVYVTAIAGVGALIGRGTGTDVLLAAAATVVVAVMFRPLRARLRRVAGRVAYGAASPTELAAGVAIHTLGAFRTFRDEVPVPPSAWQSKSARTLVKILVAQRGRPTPRQTLSDLLWPGEESERGGRRLSAALAAARSVLDPGQRHGADHFIAAAGDTIRLDLTHVVVDVEEFLRAAHDAMGLDPASRRRTTALTAAARRYSGEFLEEDRHADWAVGVREEALAAYLAVLRALAETAARSESYEAAIRHYQRILDNDRCDGEAHFGVIAALERAGRHAEAQRRYRAYVSCMDELELPASSFPAAQAPV
jgi:DNA-binding SARP family transcriptional activator/uncharacterized membrane protein YiaA